MRQEDDLATALLSRRSVSPRRLTHPGPNAEELGVMVDAALRAPDHGNLRPWRLVEFDMAQRGKLAVLFEAEKRRRDPLATEDDIVRAREHATHAPTVLAFIVRPECTAAVPLHEQWLSAIPELAQSARQARKREVAELQTSAVQRAVLSFSRIHH